MAEIPTTPPPVEARPSDVTGDGREPYGIPVFLSYPTPCTDGQRVFVRAVWEYLKTRGITARTLGVTDYNLSAPLHGVRRIMLECNGMITIAFRRMHIESGYVMARAAGEDDEPVQDAWATSPWAQIEPSMAYQLGLPILLLREKGVLRDGLLEGGIVDVRTPEFDLEKGNSFLESAEWSSIVGMWEGQVRSVVANRGRPPTQYD